MHKDPTSWDVYNWIFVISVSCAGGLVSFITKLRNGHARAFNIIEFIGEIFTSGFVGLMVFMFLQSMGYPEGVCSAAAGVSGHMATRLLFLIEKMIERRFETITHDDS